MKKARKEKARKMSMLHLYEHMKDATRDLGLDFHERGQIAVSIRGQFLQFEYDGKQVAIILPEDGK